MYTVFFHDFTCNETLTSCSFDSEAEAAWFAIRLHKVFAKAFLVEDDDICDCEVFYEKTIVKA